MDVLKKLFEKSFGAAAEFVQPLRGQLGGSERKLVRLGNSTRTAIGVVYHSREENVAFLEFSRHFHRHGLPVPEIYGDDLRHGAYLEEDLGDLTLYEYLSRNRPGGAIAPEVVTAYRKVVATLPRFQVEAGRDLNYKVCYLRARFDRQSIAWDLNYFKYYFLRLSGTPFNEQRLENDFRRLIGFLLKANSDYFLYRDFQSRNVMVRDSQPFFLDYQGGRHGALQYDIASLLFDSKADLPPDFRQQLLDHYLDELSQFVELDRDDFLRYYYGFVYIRIMQALGAYGFRGLYERKTHFLQSVPFALANLRWLLDNVELPIKLPALMKAFATMLGMEALQPAAEPERLTVRISSFSFHRGVPQDNSGHGGGFVFDARGLPNPGREERFKALTGKDTPVIDYLKQYPNVDQYLSHAEALVDGSVSNYQQRGFKHLSIAFGCTGGQHRSVYLAEALAKHLRSQDGIDVILRHRELEKLP
ncbi:MAG TPA: RNase adapter RapZ [Terriglobales bacterium]|jgi:aminoglycoside/choline kinase family phosphotransferase